MRRALFAAVTFIASLATFGAVRAALAAPSSATGAPAPAAAPDAGQSVSGCVESVPKGAERPVLTERFPARGTSGWAVMLDVTVQHGKGERVLPSGLDLSSAVEAKEVLERAGFAVPDQDGGAGAHVWSEPDPHPHAGTKTHLELPLVALPPKPGRNVMTLPPLPIAVARSNGEIATVCTEPHTIVVDDPIASTPNATPRQNPPPVPQLEEWTALKKGLLWGALGLLLGAILAYFIYRAWTKPKPLPPPPPPRPPWEIALEKLDEVRHAGLLESLRYSEYFDRVSDAVRGYLGARFGFDGLESTTDEILVALRRQAGGFVSMGDGAAAGPSPGIPLDEVSRFLAECDLVKFANLTPTPDQCAASLDAGEQIVRLTMPSATPKAPAPEVVAPTQAIAPPEPSAPPEPRSPYAPPSEPPASEPPASDAPASDAPRASRVTEGANDATGARLLGRAGHAPHPGSGDPLPARRAR